jgi:hypothetical protein
MVTACHGRNHCCAEPCHTAPYTGDGLVQEFLRTHEWRRCQELLPFCNLIEFCKDHTTLAPSKHVSLEEKLMIFLSIVAQPMTNRGAQERYQHSGDTISKYVAYEFKRGHRIHLDPMSGRTVDTPQSYVRRGQSTRLNPISGEDSEHTSILVRKDLHIRRGHTSILCQHGR